MRAHSAKITLRKKIMLPAADPDQTKMEYLPPPAASPLAKQSTYIQAYSAPVTCSVQYFLIL